MQISTEQINKVLENNKVTPDSAEVDSAVIKLTDKELIAQVTADVNNLPDREDRVAELKAKIQSGSYNPTGQEIADAMIRRTIADRIK